ncbi:9827_t:CDS:2 [Cetraspora pellucida]|uniref:9827_t:CDS:1 n=1 Tax=Cetraspora pellucida TaxID=1433469 RepID=A0ACA9LJZ6_9GLOM|nr:9827_t:CDS:2 [Cetraspora pellucida]
MLKKRLLAWYNTSNERREARSLKKNEPIKVKEANDRNKYPSTKTGLKKLKEKIKKDNLRKRLEKANSYNEVLAVKTIKVIQKSRENNVLVLSNVTETPVDRS